VFTESEYNLFRYIFRFLSALPFELVQLVLSVCSDILLIREAMESTLFFFSFFYPVQIPRENSAGRSASMQRPSSVATAELGCKSVRGSSINI